MDEANQLTFYERDLGEDFLQQALESLIAIGHQHRNPPKAKLQAGQSTREMAMAAFANRQRMLGARLSAARTAVLFAALAVEATINYYAAVLLPAPDQKLVDDLRTDRKLILVPRLAGRGALFVDDQDPMGTVRELFKLRNRIVHPKAGKKSVAQLNSEDFTPAQATNHIVGAARTVSILLADLEPDHAPGFASAIVSNAAELRKLGKAWTDPPKTPGRALTELLLASRAASAASEPSVAEPSSDR